MHGNKTQRIGYKTEHSTLSTTLLRNDEDFEISSRKAVILLGVSSVDRSAIRLVLLL